jgi:hypothetical protein
VTTLTLFDPTTAEADEKPATMLRERSNVMNDQRRSN